MENQLHTAGERAGRPRRKDIRRRAGLPAKRFFTHFARLSDVPAEDLELLSQRLRQALDLDPSSPVPALHALVDREIGKRRDAARD
ncbi:MAG: hypothetical protein HOQ06_00860 [Pseudarthrobacter sp.]|nr:hypothetical protein [Pseudarthrobacter sp.]